MATVHVEQQNEFNGFPFSFDFSNSGCANVLCTNTAGTLIYNFNADPDLCVYFNKQGETPAYFDCIVSSSSPERFFEVNDRKYNLAFSYENNGKTVYYFIFGAHHNDMVVRSDGYPINNNIAAIGSLSDKIAWLMVYSVHTTVVDTDSDPYNGLGDGGFGGGSINVPGFPVLNATSTGIVGLFSPSASQMQQLADFMWTDFGGAGTDVKEVLAEIEEALKRLISNPLDYILGLNIIPSQGLSIGDESVIKFGFVSSGVSMPRLSNQYFTVDCGSIEFPPICGDTFLDYAPYSKFTIYLPYIGAKEVDANDFVGHTIGVIYHGDVVTGGVTAYITKDGSVMYQYSGSCALNIPLSSDNWGSTLSSAVNIATAIAGGAITGGAAGVGIAAAKGAASVAANPSQLSPQVQHSGAVSGAAGCMGVQYPFVIREAVRFHSTKGFNKFSGYPSYYNRSLGKVSGFTTVLDVHLENVPATNVEIAEIENLLKSGVIL